MFKIVKTPVPLEQQDPELQHMLGYDFFTADPHSGRTKELSQTGDTEIQRLYWAKLDDLAHDLTEMIETLEAAGRGRRRRGAPSPAPRRLPRSCAGPPQAPSAAAVTARAARERAVYLAETTYDLREKRDAVRRELLTLGLRVLPDQPLPLVARRMRAGDP